MKRTHLLLFGFLSIFSAAQLCAGGGDDAADSSVLNVYCYDSFSSEWGPGPLIAEAFTEKTGIEVVFHAPGDAVTVLSQLILEKDESRADVVVGLDDALLDRTLAADILEPYSAPGLSRVDSDLVFDKSHHLLPYDYGHFAINFDTAANEDPPQSLDDLTKPDYFGQLILMDPRTSTPGLGFFLWTVAVYGDDWPEYWRRLEPTILTIADGWSQAYALYTAGEAPMVLSYGTSPVYHLEYEETHRYSALPFTDGHVRQIEGMGIVAGTPHRKSAELFLDFMLGEEAQRTLAMANIMLPVNSTVELPSSFEAALRPDKIIDVQNLGTSQNIDALIRQWIEVFGRR